MAIITPFNWWKIGRDVGSLLDLCYTTPICTSPQLLAQLSNVLTRRKKQPCKNVRVLKLKNHEEVSGYFVKQTGFEENL